MTTLRRWTTRLWGECPYCRQSMTGLYAGVLHCIRCSRDKAKGRL